jgi:hypothetical protein
MRVSLALVLLAVLGFGLSTLARTIPARAEDADQEQNRLLKKRIEILELQVAYLLDREQDLTTYATLHTPRARNLSDSLHRSRAEGFTQAAISSTSRELLLGGLEAEARAMQEKVPVVTKEQQRLLKEVDARKRAP